MLLKDKINSLWAGIIKKFHFDIFSHSLLIDVIVYETENVSLKYKVEILEISSHLFYNNTALKCKDYDFEKWDCAEITSFYYLGPNKDVFSIKSKLIDPPKNIDIKYNIFIEIWSSELYIKANKLVINNEEFNLK